MNGLKDFQRDTLISLYPLDKEGVWELHKAINPTQTVILEVVKGRFSEVVEYALSFEENIKTIKELKPKTVNPYSGKSVKELYEERVQLENKLALVNRELADADPDYE